MSARDSLVRSYDDRRPVTFGHFDLNHDNSHTNGQLLSIYRNKLDLFN